MFTAKNGRRARKSAEAELRNLVASSEELLQTLSYQIGDAVTALRVMLSRDISTAKQKMGVFAEALDSVSREAAREAARETRGFVARRPWTAVALGIVLGVAVGTAALAAIGPARR